MAPARAARRSCVPPLQARSPVKRHSTVPYGATHAHGSPRRRRRGALDPAAGWSSGAGWPPKEAGGELLRRRQRRRYGAKPLSARC